MLLAGAVAAGVFLPKCKICGRIWKLGFSENDWIWGTGTSNDTTTLTDLHFYDFIQNHPFSEGVCGICNGNNKYNKLISEGKTELTAKIKVIEELRDKSKFTRRARRHLYGVEKVLEQLEALKALKELENSYKRLSLAEICKSEIYDIPIELCEIINNHLTTILNE